MESFLGRYRNLLILVLALFVQVLGLAMQVKRGEAENTRLIRIWVVDAVTPFERVVVWAQTGVDHVWHNYLNLRGVRAENRQLREQIEQMRLQEVRLSEDAAQARRLQALLSFKEQYIEKTVAAQVIGTCGSDVSRCVYIDKGSNDGLKTDMAVITGSGIVGKILLVYPSSAQVLLVNDQSSGVGVILEKSRLQGVLRGTASGETVIERVMSDEQVEPGEAVSTSGGDQIFPKGLPVGTVSRVFPGKDLFLTIRLRPAASLSRLEEVLVITQKQERQALADDQTRQRAADILAQHLPSVPDKPPVADAKPDSIKPDATKPDVTKPDVTKNALPVAGATPAAPVKPRPKPSTASTTAPAQTAATQQAPAGDVKPQ